MNIKCAIVDDEPVSRDLLMDYINQSELLDVSGVCKNAHEATLFLNETKVDLLFLDINMPEVSGLQFYKSLNKPPFVIFTTAYPEFAVEGFELAAVDYLLKPFPYDRFLKAVTRAIRLIQQEQLSAKENDYILFKADRKIYRIEIEKIYHLEAMGDYVKVFYGDKYILVHDRFQNVLQKLPETDFIQVHKSHAISLSKVEMIDGNTLEINKKQIPIGLSYKQAFLDRLSF